MHNVLDDKKFLDFKRLLNELSAQYKVTPEDLLKAATLKIPISLFSTGLSSLEIVSKYLIENKKMPLSFAAAITGRSRQGIWQAYNHAVRKCPAFFTPEESSHDFPVTILNQSLSSLESIVSYLKAERKISYAEIARLLHRDQRTVWTVYQRAKKK